MERKPLILEMVPSDRQLELMEDMYQQHKEGKRRANFYISASKKKEELKVVSRHVPGTLMQMKDPEIRQILLADPNEGRPLMVHQFLKERDTYFAECSMLMPEKPKPSNRNVSLNIDEVEEGVTDEILEEIESLIAYDAIEVRLENNFVNAYYEGTFLGEADGYDVEDVKNFIRMGFDVWAQPIFLNTMRSGRPSLNIRVYSLVQDFSEIDVLLKEYPIEHIEKAFMLLKAANLNPASDEWEILADDVMHIDREKLKNLPSYKHPRVAEALRDRMRRATATNPTNPEFQMGVPYDFDIYGITWDDIDLNNKDLMFKLLSENYILALFIRYKRKYFGLTIDEFVKNVEPHLTPLSDTVMKRIERFNAPYNFG